MYPRSLIKALLDASAWAISLPLAVLARYDFQASEVDFAALVPVVLLAVLAQIVLGITTGLYTGRWRFGSFDEVAALVRSAAAATLTLVVVLVWDNEPHQTPRSAPLLAGVTALVLMAGLRYAWRLILERRRRPKDTAERLLVFGAGEGAAQVIPALLLSPSSPYLPVAMLDDDPAKRNLRIGGVAVVGNRRCVADAAKKFDADTLLIAIPSADGHLVTELSALATEAGLAVKVLPPVSQLFTGSVDVRDIRDVTPADLLGRHEVDTDLDSIAGYVTGRRVLVTGAGGSIGSELCRQLHRLAPSELIMVDRDAAALHAVQVSINDRSLSDYSNSVLLDIQDRPGVQMLFADRRPQVVFHAAALKHVTLLERHPADAVKVNVWGTLGLLETAVDAGVERFVNISTDKAADPCSVLGYSKRAAERLTAYFGETAGIICLSVRFGNVLGSRGSVLITFQNQIERGGPITVTDPNVHRYFMTTEEAVQLVIQAGAIGRSAEVLVLDMGEPVSIADVARLLAARAPRPIDIQYTGLRPGEKLHEARLGEGEEDRRPVHPAISHVDVDPLEPEVARALDVGADIDDLKESLAGLCKSGVRL